MSPDPSALARMRRERHARLVREMGRQGVDALVLLGGSNVSYATGVRTLGADVGRASYQRAVAVVTRDGTSPHVFASCPEAVPDELPADHVHPRLDVELPEEADLAARAISELVAASHTVGIDEYPLWLRRALERARPDAKLVDAAPVTSTARMVKTEDELACIRAAQRINEIAMRTVWEQVRPGVRTTALTGLFLREVFERGISGNVVDPVWQVMPTTIAAGPHSVTGDVVFPVPATDRELREGDVVWVDTGLTLHGYASDFGTTWVVGREPNAMQIAQFERWRDVVDRVLSRVRPGNTAEDLTRAATGADGVRPWIRYFYLAHGIGANPAEMPLVGTDRGDAFDAELVLSPGMVLVLEPIIWDEGHAGYRAEEIVAVTDHGYERLSAPAMGFTP